MPKNPYVSPLSKSVPESLLSQQIFASSRAQQHPSTQPFQHPPGMAKTHPMPQQFSATSQHASATPQQNMFVPSAPSVCGRATPIPGQSYPMAGAGAGQHLFPRPMMIPYQIGPAQLTQPQNWQQMEYPVMSPGSSSGWKPSHTSDVLPPPGHTPHPNPTLHYQSVPFYGHTHQPNGPMAPPGHAPLLSTPYFSQQTIPMGHSFQSTPHQFNYHPDHTPHANGVKVAEGQAQVHDGMGTGCNGEAEYRVWGSNPGLNSAEELLDAISTPSSSDSEESIPTLVTAEASIEDLVERK